MDAAGFGKTDLVRAAAGAPRRAFPPPSIVNQKSNCTLNLMKRAIRISVGRCQSPKVSFCTSTALELSAL